MTAVARIAVALVLVLAAPTSAFADADLVSATPADGTTVTEPVAEVSGTYAQDLLDTSRLDVLDANGALVARGGLDADDPRRMAARPDTALVEGTFTVKSTARSVDGHTIREQWTFTVALTPSASATSTPQSSADAQSAPPASASVTPAASPSSTATPADPASSTSDVLLPIIAALAVVGLGAGVLLARGRGRVR